MASLCKNPKSIYSVYAILHAMDIISHTWRHETKLKKERINKCDSVTRLIKGPNIWNVAVIDKLTLRILSFSMATFTMLRDDLHMQLFEWYFSLSFHTTYRLLFQKIKMWLLKGDYLAGQNLQTSGR